ncbi:MAG: serine/threonine protein kinase [Deltaproteobacteria bacterium]|nr:serine/threonine protein kinase [Deltaproteobacteria bacterium]
MGSEGAELAEGLKLLFPLAERRTGSVWRAERPGGEHVIVVVVDGAGNGARAPRFTRDMERIAGVAHPNVVRVLSHGTKADGRAFAVLEELRGKSLADRLAEAPAMPLSELVAIVDRLLDGLGRLHAVGVVHGDIEPANVLLCEGDGPLPTPKLIGLGVSRAALRAGKDDDPDDEGALASLAYMSPEQARGEMGDARSDIFSLGVVLYEAATGSLPFGGADARALRAAIVKGTFVPVERVRSELPRWFVDVVTKATAHEALARFASADSMRRALSSSTSAAARKRPISLPIGPRRQVPTTPPEAPAPAAPPAPRSVRPPAGPSGLAAAVAGPPRPNRPKITGGRSATPLLAPRAPRMAKGDGAIPSSGAAAVASAAQSAASPGAAENLASGEIATSDPAAAAEVAEVARAESTEVARAESTEVARAESTEVARAESTEVARAESTGVARAEPTEVARAEPTEVARAEPTGVARAEPTEVARAEQPETPSAAAAPSTEPEVGRVSLVAVAVGVPVVDADTMPTPFVSTRAKSPRDETGEIAIEDEVEVFELARVPLGPAPPPSPPEPKADAKEVKGAPPPEPKADAKDAKGAPPPEPKADAKGAPPPSPPEPKADAKDAKGAPPPSPPKPKADAKDAKGAPPPPPPKPKADAEVGRTTTTRPSAEVESSLAGAPPTSSIEPRPRVNRTTVISVAVIVVSAIAAVVAIVATQPPSDDAARGDAPPPSAREPATNDPTAAPTVPAEPPQAAPPEPVEPPPSAPTETAEPAPSAPTPPPSEPARAQSPAVTPAPAAPEPVATRVPPEPRRTTTPSPPRTTPPRTERPRVARPTPPPSRPIARQTPSPARPRTSPPRPPRGRTKLLRDPGF